MLSQPLNKPKQVPAPLTSLKPPRAGAGPPAGGWAEATQVKLPATHSP